MILTDRDLKLVAKTDEEELLTFDVSDDALERAAPIIGGVASVVTLNFGTGVLGNCACPV
jgi:hypothetical protein